MDNELLSEIYQQGKENTEHISRLNSEMGGVEIEQGKLREKFEKFELSNVTEHMEIKTDIKWVKKFQWLIITTSVSALLGIIIMLISFVLK